MIYYCKKTKKPLTEYDVNFNKTLRRTNKYDSFEKVNSLLAGKPINLLDKKWLFGFYFKYLFIFVPVIFTLLAIFITKQDLDELSWAFTPSGWALLIGYPICAVKCIKDFGSDFRYPVTKEEEHWYVSESYYKTSINDSGEISTRRSDDYDSYKTGGAVKKYDFDDMIDFGGFFKFCLFITFWLWAIPRFVYYVIALSIIKRNIFSNEMIKAYYNTKREYCEVNNFNCVNELWKEFKKRNKKSQIKLKYSYLQDKETQHIIDAETPIFIVFSHNETLFYALYDFKHKENYKKDFMKQAEKNLGILKKSEYFIKCQNKNIFLGVPFINKEKIYTSDEKDWENDIEKLYGKETLNDIKEKILLLDFNKAIFI